MTNPIINPQPNYSGVTIQIANPAVYAGGNGWRNYNAEQGVCPSQIYPCMTNPSAQQNLQASQQIPQSAAQAIPTTYPAQYYLNNYNYQNGIKTPENNTADTNIQPLPAETVDNTKTAPAAAKKEDFIIDNKIAEQQEQDLTKSTDIINSLKERNAQIQAEKKNNAKQNIVPLTDEYIKSLENYLNNPNEEIRLMASKEILTRLDEDKRRYDDAALNALLNKMLQDPSKLIRIASLSAFSSQLASGNEYTVKLLQNIQVNPNADKEDVLQAADILLKMSAGKEVKNIPDPAVKKENNKGN